MSSERIERMMPLNIRQTIYTLNPLQVEPEPPVPTVTPPEIVNRDYGVDLLKRLSSAPSPWAPDLAALDKQTMPKPQTEKRQ
ncbi:hypothetical protein AUI46_04295 [archaeon 13_1_40CM_2_52_13]|nr:MAG: hypothetical protein AUI46_04295 [archaeon 13_1_40CM_2_52_13]OLE69198.1 MAG: hypothetical protein AUF78_12165 [archaeon 13_1_20CM_2_51_12]